MNNELTEIILILDRSGSMAGFHIEAEQGINNFLREQKELPGKCKVSLYQFDDEYDTVFTCRDINEVENVKIYPRHMTALFDACGRTILDVGSRLSRTNERYRPGKVIFLIVTDGYENASKEFTDRQVREMIEHQRSKYSWQFTFIGAEIDASSSASQLGIGKKSQMKVSKKHGSSADTFGAVSRSIQQLRTSSQEDYTNAVVQQDFFDDQAYTEQEKYGIFQNDQND